MLAFCTTIGDIGNPIYWCFSPSSSISTAACLLSGSFTVLAYHIIATDRGKTIPCGIEFLLRDLWGRLLKRTSRTWSTLAIDKTEVEVEVLSQLYYLKLIMLFFSHFCVFCLFVCFWQYLWVVCHTLGFLLVKVTAGGLQHLKKCQVKMHTSPCV